MHDGRMNLIVRIWLPFFVATCTANVCRWIGAEPMVPAVLVFFGAFSFFVGPSVTGAGMIHSHHGAREVSAETPAFVWTGFGILMWLIALGTAVGSLCTK